MNPLIYSSGNITQDRKLTFFLTLTNSASVINMTRRKSQEFATEYVRISQNVYRKQNNYINLTKYKFKTTYKNIVEVYPETVIPTVIGCRQHAFPLV